MERLRDYFNRRYTVDLPAPTRFNSPFSTSFRREPSMELRLSEGQSSRISCLVKRPILFFVAFRTTSMAGSFVSTRAKRSSKSRYAERMVPKIYLMNGTTSSVPSYHPLCACARAELPFPNWVQPNLENPKTVKNKVSRHFSGYWMWEAAVCCCHHREQTKRLQQATHRPDSRISTSTTTSLFKRKQDWRSASGPSPVDPTHG